ncbi:MAG: histidinol dehydrogenase [Clostridiales bacterium]|nr:histidinol dehydrogenase [Clostridiales bacterium]
MIRILPYEALGKEAVLARTEEAPDVSAPVSAILAAVREEGDKALRRYAKEFDGMGDETPLEVSKEEIAAAAASIDPAFLAILKEAAENIRSFHKHQVRNGFVLSEQSGIVLGQKITPLKRVGLYVPGGTACYPSTVLMDSIPAKLAGVRELIMVTPAKGGVIRPEILAAASVAGVDRVFRIGGAQAVAALAYGTKSVPKADKIVGPGNVFVAEAKRQVYGLVDIDMIAGPSEILVIADAAANPRYVAADLLSQAEHDKNASAVLVTPSEALAKAVQAELEVQLSALPRQEIARASIENNGKIILTSCIEDAVMLANEIAPEHLELSVSDPFALLGDIENAGSVFLGNYCPEALGDYFAGPNHTLPTGGTAKFSSPLGVDDFIKKTQFSYYTAAALGEVAEKIACFAGKEGLDAHGRSVLCRLEDLKQ